MEIKHLILDLGGVLFDLSYEATQQSFSSLGLSEHYSKLQQASLFDDVEEGKVSEDEFYEALAANSSNGVLPSKEQLKIAWNKMLLGMAVEKLVLLERLQEKYDLYLYSNTNSIHIQQVWETLNKQHGINNLDDYFLKVYLSHEMGIRKPKEEGFELIVRENNLQKEHTLFIDDSPQHVEGALKSGIHSLWLDLSVDDLESLLLKHNLL